MIANRNRISILLLACVLAFGFFYGCKKDDPVNNTDQTIKLGFLFPFTGLSGGDGTGNRKAIDLAVEQINASGALIDGKKLEVVSADSEFDTEKAKTAAQSLIDKGVVGIVGEIYSFLTLAASEKTIPANVAMISPSATSPKLTTLADNNLVYRVCLSDAIIGSAMATYARNTMTLNKVNIIYVTDAYGEGLRDNFKERFTALGGVVGAEISVPPLSESELAAYNFSNTLTQAFAGNPDAVYFLDYQQETIKMLTTYETSGIRTGSYDPFLLITDATTGSESLVQAVAPTTEAKILGMYGASDPTRQQNLDFEAAYRAKYNNEEPQGQDYYDIVMLYALAIVKANSENSRDIANALQSVSAGGDAYGPGQFAAARQKLADGGDVNYEGAGSFCDFDANGDASKGLIKVVDIQSGAFHDVLTFEYTQ